jgi:MoaA/NifB/PqqE/SkfB family radical SAM enzyme
MKEIPIGTALRLIARGTKNYLTNRALAVSYEVTHSCTANCHHCDKGGLKKEKGLLMPEDYRRLQTILKPLVVQMSGGEPLTRNDIVDIARAIKEPGGVPYLILVTNASLLTKEKYLELKSVGVNQLSISLDFPDERHDKFRRVAGLYKRLEKLIPELAGLGNDDIVINTAITKENLPYLREIQKKTIEWGVAMSFSAYTPLRTGDQDYMISAEEDLELLHNTMQDMIRIKRNNGNIINSEWTLEGTYSFFKNGYMPGCKAGLRYFVVTPTGKMHPCSMHHIDFDSQEEIIKGFVRQNKCGDCYVAIRAYLDKPYLELLVDNVKNRVLNRNGSGSC